MIKMGRIDFSPEKFEEFKKYVKQYFGTNKMKLLVLEEKGEIILRTRLATRYDSAYISGLSNEQIREFEKFVGDSIEIWHPRAFFWDEEVKIKAEEE